MQTHDKSYMTKIEHVLTVDVEDYFHVAALSNSIKPDDWAAIQPRVVDNVHRLLDLFDEHDVKVTHFFWAGLRSVSPI